MVRDKVSLGIFVLKLPAAYGKKPCYPPFNSWVMRFFIY